MDHVTSYDFYSEDSDAVDPDMENYLYSMIHHDYQETSDEPRTFESSTYPQPSKYMNIDQSVKPALKSSHKHEAAPNSEAPDDNSNSRVLNRLNVLKIRSKKRLNDVSSTFTKFNGSLYTNSKMMDSKETNELDDTDLVAPVLHCKNANSNCITILKNDSSSLESGNCKLVTSPMDVWDSDATDLEETMNISSNIESSDEETELDKLPCSTNIILGLNSNRNSCLDHTLSRLDVTNFLDCISQDASLWKVDPAERFSRSRTSGHRFFDASHTNTCSTCLKKGHFPNDCQRTGPVCILCGMEGHLQESCRSIFCHACFEAGHSVDKCRRKDYLKSSVCRRCGAQGHDYKVCEDQWMQYHMTTAPGPPFRQKKITRFPKAACCNCGRRGHFSDECRRPGLRSRFLGTPSHHMVCCYDSYDIYNTRAVMKKRSVIQSQPPQPSSFVSSTPVTLNQKRPISEPDQRRVSKRSPGQPNSNQLTMISAIDPGMSSSASEMRNDGVPAENMLPDFLPLAGSAPMRRSQSQKLEGSTTESEDRKVMVPDFIPRDLLHKLFPDITEGKTYLTKNLRRRLRKKLKYLISQGYIPGDTTKVERRMEAWLYSVADGEALTFKKRWKLLDSVSAALHSIRPRVSDAKGANESSKAEDGDQPLQRSSQSGMRHRVDTGGQTLSDQHLSGTKRKWKHAGTKETLEGEQPCSSAQCSQQKVTRVNAWSKNFGGNLDSSDFVNLIELAQDNEVGKGKARRWRNAKPCGTPQANECEVSSNWIGPSDANDVRVSKRLNKPQRRQMKHAYHHKGAIANEHCDSQHSRTLPSIDVNEIGVTPPKQLGWKKCMYMQPERGVSRTSAGESFQLCDNSSMNSKPKRKRYRGRRAQKNVSNIVQMNLE